MTNNRGFTIIELLLVIAIIGALSAIGMISFVGAQKSARDTRRQSDLREYQTALEIYANRSGGSYPIGNGTDLTTMCGAAVLNISGCSDDPTASQSYLYSSSGIDYVLWAKMERITLGGANEYYILCSNGKVGRWTAAPSGSNCPL